MLDDRYCITEEENEIRRYLIKYGFIDIKSGSSQY